MKLILTCKKKNVRCIDLTFHFNSSTFCHYSVGHLVVKLESASCCTSWPSSCWSSVEGAASAGGSNWLWGSILPRHRRQHLSCWLSWLCHLWSHADRPAAGEKKKKSQENENEWHRIDCGDLAEMNGAWMITGSHCTWFLKEGESHLQWTVQKSKSAEVQ